MEDAPYSPSGVHEDLAETIVVGHDGSRDAEAACDYALGLAERLASPLLVLRAWTIDTAPHGTLVSEGYVSSFEEADITIARVVERDTAPLVAAHPSVPVTYRAKFGQPAEVLIEASAHAMMLVLGRRGRGGFASLLLGSVSEQCARHAHCPVLILRPHEENRGHRS